MATLLLTLLLLVSPLSLHPVGGIGGSVYIPAAWEQEGGSSLRLSPEEPRLGQRLDVSYSPSPSLSGEATLHLRGRLRRAEDGSYNDGMGSETVAVLRRHGDGTYQGSFRLPTDVVYAALAVEDPQATRVDSKEGRFWEVLFYEDVGRPLFESLDQRFSDHMGRDELVVLESARELARLYPRRPQAWTLLKAAEGWVLGEEGAEERAAAHADRLAEFDGAFRERADLTSDEVAYLYWYARGDYRDLWRERLLESFPGHFFALQERAMALQKEHAENPTVLMEGLETLWKEAEDDEGRLRVLRSALSVAMRQEDPELILIWATRWRESDPTAGLNVALTLANTDGTREEGIAALQGKLSALLAVSDEDRPLGSTMASHREDCHRRASTLLRYQGEALLAVGRLDEGIRALEEAAEEEWNGELHRALAEAFHRVEESESALAHFAAAAADPGLSPEARDSLRLMAGVELGPWGAAVAEARGEMLEGTLQTSVVESLPPVRITRVDGTGESLRGRLGEDATVLVFWSRYCGHSNQAMGRIQSLGRELAAQGVPFLAVTRNPVEEAMSYVEEEGLDLQILFDSGGEAARAFNSWGTPQYFILDGSGFLRFSFTGLDDIHRQVQALLWERERPVRDSIMRGGGDSPVGGR